MKSKLFSRRTASDADGTEEEENRQLTNLLLRNAVMERSVKAYPERGSNNLLFSEVILLGLVLFMLNIYTFLWRLSGLDEEA